MTRARPVANEREQTGEAPLVLTRALGPLDFEHNPGFLVGRLSRRISAEVDRRMREHGLTLRKQPSCRACGGRMG